MKKIFITLLMACASFYAQAQYALPVGGKQLNAGVGFSSWGIPIYVGMDFGVHKDISVGGELSFRSWNAGKYYDLSKTGFYDYSFSVFGIAANGNYHFNYLLKIPKEWDFYAGVNLGIYILSSSNNVYAASYIAPGVGLQVGGRYYFSDKFGINLEFGGGNVFGGGKVGITYKF